MSYMMLLNSSKVSEKLESGILFLFILLYIHVILSSIVFPLRTLSKTKHQCLSNLLTWR